VLPHPNTPQIIDQKNIPQKAEAVTGSEQRSHPPLPASGMPLTRIPSRSETVCLLVLSPKKGGIYSNKEWCYLLSLDMLCKVDFFHVPSSPCPLKALCRASEPHHRDRLITQQQSQHNTTKAMPHTTDPTVDTDDDQASRARLLLELAQQGGSKTGANGRWTLRRSRGPARASSASITTVTAARRCVS
jgi:hypothetical protein